MSILYFSLKVVTDHGTESRKIYHFHVKFKKRKTVAFIVCLHDDGQSL